MSELIIVAADGTMEKVLKKVFGRPESFGVSVPDFQSAVHPGHDPGCFKAANNYLKDLRSNHRHALVVLDAAWDGAPSAGKITEKIYADLVADWGNDADVVVIEPELEAWIWSRSLNVIEEVIHWSPPGTLRTWLASNDLWPEGQALPPDPKAAFEEALRHVGTPRSASIYERLAERVSLVNCDDAAFNKLRAVFGKWYPAT